jgi:hypothetical protein
LLQRNQGTREPGRGGFETFLFSGLSCRTAKLTLRQKKHNGGIKIKNLK